MNQNQVGVLNALIKNLMDRYWNDNDKKYHIKYLELQATPILCS